MVIGHYRQFLGRKRTIAEMILIVFRLPGFGIFETVGHVRYQIEHHHEFIEMVQIIRRQERFFIDIRLTRPRPQFGERVVRRGIFWGFRR